MAEVALQRLQPPTGPADDATPLRAAPSRGGYTRQRQGCLTCRHRKKRCDRQYPLCGHCARLNLACEREEPRKVVQGAKRSSIDATSDTGSLQQASAHIDHVARIYMAVDELLLRDEILDGDLLTSRRSILRYYTSVFAIMLSTNHENNCFLSVMIPMAFECAPLMKSLVAWASSHLAAREPSFSHTALRHRGSALSAIKVALDDNELSAEMCLAVAMVFCSMESISDRQGLWYQHLLGGAAALGFGRNASGQPAHHPATLGPLVRLTTTEGGWLLQNFAYHDVLMSITLDCRPLIPGSYWIDPQDSDKADPYFGLASRIIYLTSRISELNADLLESVTDTQATSKPFSTAKVTRSHHRLFLQRVSEPAGVSGLFGEACKIESELLDWSCPQNVDLSPLQLLAESYRSAALLHLYRTLRRHHQVPAEELSTKIHTQVAVICDTIKQMPEGCLAECTLLFPLFMAGGEAEDAAHTESIREKLLMINKWRHFQDVDHALEVLDELWRLRAMGALGQNGQRLDWLDITKSRGIKLAIS